MTTPSDELVERVFPGTARRTPVEGFTALMTSARARAELGFVLRHPWRDQVARG